MKKLSIEEKAKRYDKAIELAKDSYNYPSYPGFIRADVVFPELKESEDGRVRKEILQELKESEDSIILSPFKRERWIAWLESHGEKSETDVQETYSETLFKIATVLSQHEDKQGSPLEKIREIMIDGACCAIDAVKIESKKEIERNSAWDEEDKDYFDAIIAKLEVTQDDALLTNDQMEFLKSLKDRVQPQPKQEWIKEDVAYINSLCDVVKDSRWCKEGKISFINWLKALKERYTWKPTNEQMKALDDVISSRNVKYDVLSELWNDLNKLKKV